MPYELEDWTSPAGTRMGRITYRGRMSASDAHELLTVLNPGGRFGEVPVLVDALELSAFPPDARQVAAGFPIVYGPPRVIVIKDVVLRMVLTFVTRMQGLPLLSAPDLPRGVERIEAEWVRYQAGPRPSRLPRATEDPRSPGE